MVRDRSLRQSAAMQHPRVSFAGKENIPPVDQKRKASLAGLFDRPQTARTHHVQKSRSALQPVQDLFSNTAGGGPDIFGQIKSSSDLTRAKLKHDLLSEQEFVRENDKILREILARLDGVDGDGNSVNIEGLPSKDDMQNLKKQHHSLSRPIEDDQLTLQTKKADGTVSHRLVSLSDSLAQFSECMMEQRKKFVEYRRELYRVEDEIKTIHQDLIQQKDPAYQQAKDKLAAQQIQQQQKLKMLKQKHAEDLEDMKKSQKAAAKKKKSEFEKAIQSMLDEVSDGDE